jgi:hypothetical protein
VLSPEEVRTLLTYDPSTGTCQWKTALCKRRDFDGVKAGYLDGSTGRWRIQINGKGYLRSNVAWCIMTGSWPDPKLDVDHINRNQLDDRWCNLRQISRSNNARNSQSRGRKTVNHDLPYGIKPSRNKTGWIARFTVNGKREESPTFYTIEEAVAFRKRRLELLGLDVYYPQGG